MVELGIGFGIWGLGLQSGSLAIISKRVRIDLVLSIDGGGELGFNRPAVRAELNLLKESPNSLFLMLL